MYFHKPMFAIVSFKLTLDFSSCYYYYYDYYYYLICNILICQFFYRHCTRFWTITKKDGVQHLEQPNVARPIFRDFEISNIKIPKVEVFDFSNFEFIFHFYDCLNYSNTQNTHMIIYHEIRNFWNFDSVRNCQILKIC